MKRMGSTLSLSLFCLATLTLLSFLGSQNFLRSLLKSSFLCAPFAILTPQVVWAAAGPYTSCLENTFLNLPIGTGGLKEDIMSVWAHHWDARTGKWNEDIRLEPLPRLEKEPCSIWEVGAHKEAADSRRFMNLYPLCEYHAFEPIPSFYRFLFENWKRVDSMSTHNYGISRKNYSINVPLSAIKGESTYMVNDENEKSAEQAQIKSFDFAVIDAGGPPTLLHLNCEGCEWTFLPEAVEARFLNKIPIIQIGFHNYGKEGLGKRAIQYCRIQEMLNETHDLVEGAVPFAWERWLLRKD